MKKMMIALLAASALFVGCDKGGSSGGAGEAGSVGVAECDEYIKKMEACFAKDPTTKAAMEGTFKQLRDGWKTAAAQGGAAKDALKTGCKTSLDSIPANCK